MFKKILAAVATVLLGAGLAVTAVAAPAAAHHTDITATAACAPGGGYDVTWKVVNSENLSAKVTASSNTSVVALGTVLPANPAYNTVNSTSNTFVQHVWNTNPLVLTLGVKWSNNITDNETGNFSAFPRGCSTPTDAVDCVAATVYTGEALTNGDHINMTIIQDGASFQTNAQIDIRQAQDPQSESGLVMRITQKTGPNITLPITNAQKISGVFTFTYSSYLSGEWIVDWVQYDTHNLHFTGELSCGTPLYDATAAISTTPATCDAAAVLVLGAVANATWGAVTGAYSVTATAASGHRFAADATPGVIVSADGKTKTFTGTLAPKLTGGTCIPTPECLPKTSVSYTYSPVTNSGTVTVVNPKPARYSNELCQGFWVTATSWKFLAGNSVWPQKLDHVQKLAKITSVGSYDYEAPVLCGQGDIYASFVAQPDPSPYLLGPNQPGTGPTTPGGAFIETFLHNMGFSTSTPGPTYMQNAPGCNKVPVVEPTVKTITECGTYGSITATDTALVDYTITPDNGQSLLNMQGSYTVTAVAISPAVLDGSYPAGGWTFDLGDYTDCYEPAVSFELGGCYPNGSVSSKNLYFLFDNTTSTVPVTFTVPGATDVSSALNPKPSITVVVAAGGTAKVETTPAGNAGTSHDVYADGVLLKKITVDPFVGCLDSKPGDPKATPAGCVAGVPTLGNIWVDLVPGLEYTITGTNPGNTTLISPVNAADNALPAGTYEVTVLALPGYVLGGTTSWPYDITIDPPVNCVKPFAKAELGTIPATCVFDGSIDNSKVVLEHATWDAALPTAPGTYTVTATAETGYTFDGTATTKSIPVTIGAAVNAPNCQPTLGLVIPKVSSTPFSCTANGSYTLGVDTGFDPAHIKWTVNGTPNIPSGTYPVTTSQVVTIVAVPVAPNGIDAAWINPAPITFIKPTAITCGDLPTLAFTGGAVTLGVQTLVGGLLFVLVGGALIIRRKLQERSAE